MEFVITEGESKSRMRISGRLDTLNSEKFEKRIQELLPLTKDLEIDCANLEYISSSGLRCFLFLLKSAQESKHTVTLVNMTAPIKEVFDITGFSSMFAIE